MFQWARIDMYCKSKRKLSIASTPCPLHEIGNIFIYLLDRQLKAQVELLFWAFHNSSKDAEKIQIN